MNIVVVGAGTMGSGIAYSSAASGHAVTVIEQDQKLLDQGMHRVHDYVERNLGRGHINKDQATKIQSNVKGSVDFAKACHNADLVVIGRGIMQHVLGSLRTHVYSIIREAPCPVISV